MRGLEPPQGISWRPYRSQGLPMILMMLSGFHTEDGKVKLHWWQKKWYRADSFGWNRLLQWSDCCSGYGRTGENGSQDTGWYFHYRLWQFLYAQRGSGITTIAHPQEKLGEMAAELILEKINGFPEETGWKTDLSGTDHTGIMQKNICKQMEINNKSKSGRNFIMKTGRNYKFWFIAGSDLYGDECLRKVAEHSKNHCWGIKQERCSSIWISMETNTDHKRTDP